MDSRLVKAALVVYTPPPFSSALLPVITALPKTGTVAGVVEETVSGLEKVKESALGIYAPPPLLLVVLLTKQKFSKLDKVRDLVSARQIPPPFSSALLP
ncbi:Uncharacterised protein [Chlamydia abortus]|nr:Uncharacterised protein [Chlamydia abortus]